MTSQSSLETAWILEATVQAAHGADPHWREQLKILRPIAGYDPTAQTWRVRLGALDLAGLHVLQALFDAAHKHGTEVHLAPVAVPESWAGPVFARTAEMATLLETQADQGRPLGQLRLA
ncbi:hypothetical protein [Streptomyces sp. NBC_00568]|uniref:hypothetical protein n=1 Tax=Streptomyces sp. NBC_00568 TaxID=2975779 RepID=UPI002259ADDC|nr:hypothetical protein [Streptomyces sp. NBC_00568]MCX4993477.1 hypothetical protein [Streptomyces sp. NBC_00568]